MTSPNTELLVFFAVMVMPMAMMMLARRKTDIDGYLANAGGNTRWVVTLSAIGGNVGIGTFIALYLFSSLSPLVGLSVAIAYGVGLLLCAFAAPHIRARSRQLGTIGLVDFMAVGGGVGHPLALWVPVAIIFILRSAVQLTAMAVILSGLAGVSALTATVAVGLFTGGYAASGGYRAAMRSDVVQAIIILGGTAVMLFGIMTVRSETAFAFENMLSIGPYQPIFLIGIWLLLPATPLLSIDNWHRIVTADSDAAAQSAFVVAGLSCFGVYFVITLLGMLVPGDDVVVAMAGTMPHGLAFVGYAVLAATVMSSLDTFIVPLTSTLSRLGLTLAQLRLAVSAMFLGMVVVAHGAGSVLGSIVAAFNSMVVLLPSLVAAFWGWQAHGRAVILSVTLGMGVALAMTVINPNSAAVAGFFASTAIFISVRRWG